MTKRIARSIIALLLGAAMFFLFAALGAYVMLTT